MAAPMEFFSRQCKIDEKCVVEASVVTGFEEVAKQEVLEKIVGAEVVTSMGKIFILLNIAVVKSVIDLKSVDNCYIVLSHFPQKGISTNELSAMKQFRDLVYDIDWSLGLDVWAKFYTFSHPIISVPEVIPDNLGIPILVFQEKMPKQPKKPKKWKPKVKWVNGEVNEKGENVPTGGLDGCAPRSTESVVSQGEYGQLHHVSGSNDDERMTSITDQLDRSNISPDVGDIVQSHETQPKMDRTKGPAENLLPSVIHKSDADVKSDEILPNCDGDSLTNIRSPPSTAETTDSQLNETSSNPTKDKLKTPRDPSKPSFRATCYRTGTSHTFRSMCAAANFGGAINEYFQWNVDLTGFDIEVVLNINDDDVYVCIALTSESLHRRNIQSFGPTTLKPTIAYNMLRLCEIAPGDLVCDPMCGGGSIPIEAAINWPSSCHISGEIHEIGANRSVENIEAVNQKSESKGRSHISSDIMIWDACHLPFRDSSVDVFITDLPFGRRMGRRIDNWTLYPSVLYEMARVSKPLTGRACLLTHDKKCMIKTLMALSKFWRRKSTLFINIGGLTAGVYLLQRKYRALSSEDTFSLGATLRCQPGRNAETDTNHSSATNQASASEEQS